MKHEQDEHRDYGDENPERKVRYKGYVGTILMQTTEGLRMGPIEALSESWKKWEEGKNESR